MGNKPLVPANWSSVSSHRAVVLCAIGAFAGLALAGFGLFTSKGTRTLIVPPEDVALVNGTPILTTDFDALVAATYNISPSQATPEQRKAILDSMITEELYVQRGIELGMQADVIEVRQALVTAVEAQQTADSIAEPFNDADLQAFYKAHSDLYLTEGKMLARDFIAPDLAHAQTFVAALQAKATPAKAAESAGLRQSAMFADGPEFYFAAKIHLDPALFASAQALPPGKWSQPVALPDGVHVIVMEQNEPQVPLPLETVKDKVLADLRDAKTKRIREASGAFLRRRADILVAKGFD